MLLRHAKFAPLALALILGVSCAVRAQTFSGNATVKPIKGFKIAEPYGPPHETQTKSVLEGGTAVPLPGGKTHLMDGVLLRTFSETNTPLMIGKCQECFYDTGTRLLYSAGALEMQSADGKFAITGTGFRWEQTNSSLVLSNAVHTVIQGGALQAMATNRLVNPGLPQTTPLVIDSDKFAYDHSSGVGTWNGTVVVTSSNLVLHSAVLRAEVPANQRQLQSLVAQTNVSVKYGSLHATGQHLTYSPDTGLIRITNQATWDMNAEQRQGGGDELVLDRTNQIFQVRDHAWLKLPGDALGPSGFLSVSNAPGRASNTLARSSAEVVCDRYEIHTNWATFEQHVRLTQKAGDALRGSLTCQTMTLTFSGTNQMDTLDARENVVIEQVEKQLTGGRAFYTHTNTTLEMTGNPTWRSGDRQGKGRIVRLNTQSQELFVKGNAWLTLPARELAGQLTGTATNLPAARVPAGTTNQFAEIFCEQYRLGPVTSAFEGGVYATHPEIVWSCEKLLVQHPAPGLTNVVAKENVVFDLVTPREKAHGTGDQGVYTFGLFDTITNGLMPINELRLTGTPAVLTSTNITSRNPLIIWDRLRNKVMLPGNEYSIQGVGKAVDTNIFQLPKGKGQK